MPPHSEAACRLGYCLCEESAGPDDVDVTLHQWQDTHDAPEEAQTMAAPDGTGEEPAARPLCSACRCTAGSHDEGGACWTPDCTCGRYMPMRTEWDG